MKKQGLEGWRNNFSGALSLVQTDLNPGFDLAAEYVSLHSILYYLKVPCSLLSEVVFERAACRGRSRGSGGPYGVDLCQSMAVCLSLFSRTDCACLGLRVLDSKFYRGSKFGFIILWL